MTSPDVKGQNQSVLRQGDVGLLSILSADFFGALAGSTVHLTMVWWVLSQGVPAPTVSLLVLCIFLPLNVGVLLTGVAVERFGPKRLLIGSKLVATGGAIACCLLLATETMTLTILAIVAIVTYGAMSPSIAADISRVPALTRLAKRRLAGFHAVNGIALVLGQVGGLGLAGYLARDYHPSVPVGISIAFVCLSVFLTWIGFPRDRHKPQKAHSIWSRIRALSMNVIKNVEGPIFNFRTVAITAATIATAQGCVEVALPIAVHAAGLPTTALSAAYFLAIGSGIGATLVAQAIYERVRLSSALFVISTGLLAVMLVASSFTDITGMFLAVGATSAAAAAAGTLAITALQEKMPQSLQAQAIGLWEFLILSVGSLTILATGALNNWSLIFITSLALLALLIALQNWVSSRNSGA